MYKTGVIDSTHTYRNTDIKCTLRASGMRRIVRARLNEREVLLWIYIFQIYNTYICTAHIHTGCWISVRGTRDDWNVLSSDISIANTRERVIYTHGYIARWTLVVLNVYARTNENNKWMPMLMRGRRMMQRENMQPLQ